VEPWLCRCPSCSPCRPPDPCALLGNTNTPCDWDCVPRVHVHVHVHV
jgi:hypothetical protein